MSVGWRSGLMVSTLVYGASGLVRGLAGDTVLCSSSSKASLIPHVRCHSNSFIKKDPEPSKELVKRGKTGAVRFEIMLEIDEDMEK